MSNKLRTIYSILDKRSPIRHTGPAKALPGLNVARSGRYYVQELLILHKVVGEGKGYIAINTRIGKLNVPEV